MWVIQLFEEYWMRDAGDHIDEIYDLEKASQFKTKKAANELIKQTAYGEYCKVKKYEDVIDDFLKWKEGGMVRRELDKINEKYCHVYNGEGLEEVIEWNKFRHEHEDQVTYEVYKTWPMVNKFLDNFYDMAFFNSRDYSERYATFKIMIRRDKADFKSFKKEIDLLTPHVTYLDEETDEIIFDIFEHTCSEFDSYYLRIGKDDKCRIVGSRGYYGDKFKGTLKQCFNELVRTYYYD